MNRKIHVEIAKDQVEGETCYMCGKPAVIAVRGDMNERGTGFCLCKDCFTKRAEKGHPPSGGGMNRL